jgi:hypothetical protein
MELDSLGVWRLQCEQDVQSKPTVGEMGSQAAYAVQNQTFTKESHCQIG